MQIPVAIRFDYATGIRNAQRYIFRRRNVVFRSQLHEMSEVVSTATLFGVDLSTDPGLLSYFVEYGCQTRALVHTSAEYTRDWCI